MTRHEGEGDRNERAPETYSVHERRPPIGNGGPALGALSDTVFVHFVKTLSVGLSTGSIPPHADDGSA